MRGSANKTCVLGFMAVACLFSGGVHSQSYLSPGYILGEVRQGMGFYRQPEAPEFVKRGRPDPATLDYKPLKPPPRDFHDEASKPAQRLEAEAPVVADLEAARAKTQARAAGAGGRFTAQKARAASQSAASASGDDLPPMNWNPWDTE